MSPGSDFLMSLLKDSYVCLCFRSIEFKEAGGVSVISLIVFQIPLSSVLVSYNTYICPIT